jgi:hypothetical protein
MQLITNRIQTGNGGSFADFVAKYKKEHNIKTASTEEDNVKVAAEQEEADSSGQLDVEPLHQEGESTTMPKAGPSAKKEGKDEKAASATDTDPEKEGKDSGQCKAEGSEKFTNKVKFDPNDSTDEEKGIVDAGSESETKVASGACDACNCDPCECKDAGTKEEETKEAGTLPDALKDNQFKSKDEEEKEAKVEDKEETKEASTKEEEVEEKEAEVEDKKEETKEASTKDEEVEEKEAEVEDKKEKEAEVEDKKEETKEATAKVEFVKLANLDSKNKKFLTDYWRQLFGNDYVNALVADK